MNHPASTALAKSGDSQAVAPKGRKPRRRRIASVHRGALAQLDAALEARCDSEQVADEYEVRRPDAQDLFAWKTRRLLRLAEGLVRSVDARVRAIEEELRGQRPARRQVA